MTEPDESLELQIEFSSGSVATVQPTFVDVTAEYEVEVEKGERLKISARSTRLYVEPVEAEVNIPTEFGQECLETVKFNALEGLFINGNKPVILIRKPPMEEAREKNSKAGAGGCFESLK